MLEPTPTTPVRRVALYARQPKDDPNGIDRQLPRLRKMAAERGWEVYDEYPDDGESVQGARS